MKNKLKVLDKSDIQKCWACEDGRTKTCKICNGTGTWREPSYIMIAEQPNGQKIAFQSDFIK